ncbi:MAG: entericidin A/B family lipoprotein [Rhodobacteraceae bacterium]|nr:entericidin A/B family lipoprotein [Paracoccaceae bacterium]
MIRLFLGLAALAGLSACATIEGAGKDLQTAGQAIETEAQDAQNGY